MDYIDQHSVSGQGNQKKVKVGVIGLGVGVEHLETYEALPHVDVVGVCDSNQERLDSVAIGSDAGRYRYSTELLDECVPDIVSICVPSYLHRDMALEAIERGVSVVVEKPMALTASDCLEIGEAAGSRGVFATVAHNFRFRDDIYWLGRQLRSGGLGRLASIDVRWVREAGIPTGSWFGRREHSGGGVLTDLGCHLVDLILYLLDFPEVHTISATTSQDFLHDKSKYWNHREATEVTSLEADYDVEDSAFVFMRMGPGDIRATMYTAWASHIQSGADILQIRVDGTLAAVDLQVSCYSSGCDIQWYGAPCPSPLPFEVSGGPVGRERMLSEVVRAFRNGGDPTPSAKDAAEVMSVVGAAYRSARLRSEVRLNKSHRW